MFLDGDGVLGEVRVVPQPSTTVEQVLLAVGEQVGRKHLVCLTHE